MPAQRLVRVAAKYAQDQRIDAGVPIDGRFVDRESDDVIFQIAVCVVEIDADLIDFGETGAGFGNRSGTLTVKYRKSPSSSDGLMCASAPVMACHVACGCWTEQSQSVAQMCFPAPRP